MIYGGLHHVQRRRPDDLPVGIFLAIPRPGDEGVTEIMNTPVREIDRIELCADDRLPVPHRRTLGTLAEQGPHLCGADTANTPRISRSMFATTFAHPDIGVFPAPLVKMKPELRPNAS